MGSYNFPLNFNMNILRFEEESCSISIFIYLFFYIFRPPAVTWLSFEHVYHVFGYPLLYNFLRTHIVTPRYTIIMAFIFGLACFLFLSILQGFVCERCGLCSCTTTVLDCNGKNLGTFQLETMHIGTKNGMFSTNWKPICRSQKIKKK